MGWVWSEGDGESSGASNSINISGDFENSNPSSGGHCSTRKIVKSKCNTVEVEPGKFVRKCEKTQQTLRDCVGKPTEILESNKEYTEEDVTNEWKNGSSSFLGTPGLRSDLEAIERGVTGVFGGLNRLFDAANEMGNGFFRIFDDPSLFDGDSSSSSKRKGVPIEGPAEEETKEHTIDSGSGSFDLSGLTRDV